MALLITDECINCDICEPECPNDAIYMGAEIYESIPTKCTECVGTLTSRNASQVCPVSCIPFNPAWRESPEQLMAKLRTPAVRAARRQNLSFSPAPLSGPLLRGASFCQLFYTVC